MTNDVIDATTISFHEFDDHNNSTKARETDRVVSLGSVFTPIFFMREANPGVAKRKATGMHESLQSKKLHSAIIKPRSGTSIDHCPSFD